ncbi:MAG TPA: KEOPS complex kinase/ATPase Bud32 [Thermoplasmata archaeon]|nr:KEOPS complex kinase/ATPase Bud32 [Thermoplasmata archaeon]
MKPPAPAASESVGREVSRGAEAQLHVVEWLGLDALRKERDAKAYRPKALDERLRRERTRNEVRLLAEARRLGVRTPIVYDVDLEKNRIILEHLPGPTLRELLEAGRDDPAGLEPPVRSFGTALGRLHAGGISHGDLTSSNVLFPDGPTGTAALIDLSMGARSAGLEERGIDLHLVEEDLKALHPKGEALYRSFLAGYEGGNPEGAKDVRKRAREIKGRIRYA